MKKIGMFSFLIAAALAMLISCAGQQGPLSPDSSLVNSVDANLLPKPIVTIVSNPTTLTEPVVYHFINPNTRTPMAMDATTLTNANIRVFYKTSNTEEAELTGISISYNRALYQVSINPASAWFDNTQYRVLFSNAIHSAQGASLDGNGNKISESSVFDNAHDQFSLGVLSGIDAYILSALTVNSMSLYDAGGPQNIGMGNHNSIQAGTYIYITITTAFSSDVDASTLVVSSTELHNNFSLVNDITKAIVQPIGVSMVSADTLQCIYTLPANARYCLTINGGTSGVSSSNDATVPLLRGRLFGGENSVAEAVDQYIRYFTTVQAGSASNAPPQVISVSPDPGPAEPAYYGNNDRYWLVEYLSPSSGAMNASTIANPSNYQLEAEYNGSTYNVSVKAIQYIDPLTVRVYVPDMFYPATTTSTPNVTMRVIVNRNVQSSDGLSLDGNADGIGGTVQDDFRSYPYTVSSGR